MTRLEDGSVLFAVYGTLRKGNGNHVYVANAEFLGEMKTEPKFTMYGKNWGFPIVSTTGDTSLTVEVYKTKDEKVINGVNRLERYSGVRNHPQNWYDTVDIETPWGNANMFVMETERGTEKDIIVDGDWNNR